VAPCGAGVVPLGRSPEGCSWLLESDLAVAVPWPLRHAPLTNQSGRIIALNSNVETFRKLHSNSTPLYLPNAWDPVSAGIFQDAGAKAIATTSAGMSWSLGYRDGRMVPFEEVLGATKRIMRVVKVPVSIDVENGYSDDPETVAQNVLRLAELGVAGINLEDGSDPPSLLAMKIEAIRSTLSRASTNLFVNARCDVFLAQLAPKARLVEESIFRGNTYATAGADGLFLPAVINPNEIREVAAKVQIPLNVMAMPGLVDGAQLGALGVRRLSAGGGIAQIVWGVAAQRGAAFLQDGDSAVVAGEGLSYGKLQAIFPAA
jgi:2-methylisocitrate lyase-like PEP mutase family enzyme